MRARGVVPNAARDGARRGDADICRREGVRADARRRQDRQIMVNFLDFVGIFFFFKKKKRTSELKEKRDVGRHGEIGVESLVVLSYRGTGIVHRKRS